MKISVLSERFKAHVPSLGHGLKPPPKHGKKTKFHSRHPQHPSEGGIIHRVMTYLKQGDSELRDPLRSGEITSKDVIHAIKNDRCIASKKRDFGHTYLSNVIGNAIHDVIPSDQVRSARKTFGLEI